MDTLCVKHDHIVIKTDIKELLEKILFETDQGGKLKEMTKQEIRKYLDGK